MPKVGTKLMRVDAASAHCAKKKCCTDNHTLHRHHRRHQAMWIGVWLVRRRGEQKFVDFCYRYHAFNPEDWTRLCANHHAEIHMVYDQIIRRDVKKVGRPLSQYSWAQAEKLMDKLEAVCVEWLQKETPGVTSERLNELRERYAQRQQSARNQRAIREIGYYLHD